MRLLGLQIYNLRKVRCAELKLDEKGNLIQIRGRNKAGKSTVVLAAEILLGGKTFIPNDVITHGEEEARIVGRIEDYTIKRVIKQNGNSYLSIEKEGMKKSKPQDFLNTLSGKFLDPQWFGELSGDDKKKILMKYLDIDFSGHDAKIAKLENDRVLKGREIKALGKPESGLKKVEKVNFDELLTQRQSMEEFNKIQDERKSAIEKYNSQISELETKKIEKNSEIEKEKKYSEEELLRLKKVYEDAVARENERCNAKVTGLEEEVITLTTRIDKGYEIVGNAPAQEKKRDMQEINEKIRNAASINQEAEMYLKNETLKNDIQIKEDEYENIQATIKTLKKEKQDMLKNAQMPIEGLKIGDNGLLFNGITDENWSDSEGLKIGMHISAALSKELKTMFIKRGESLDSASLNEIKAFAEENNYQVIIEIVDDSYDKEGDGIIYLEEGEIINEETSPENPGNSENTVNPENQIKDSDGPWIE